MDGVVLVLTSFEKKKTLQFCELQWNFATVIFLNVELTSISNLILYNTDYRFTSIALQYPVLTKL